MLGVVRCPLGASPTPGAVKGRPSGHGAPGQQAADACADSPVTLQPMKFVPSVFSVSFRKERYFVFVEYRAFKMSIGSVLVLFCFKSVISVYHVYRLHSQITFQFCHLLFCSNLLSLSWPVAAYSASCRGMNVLNSRTMLWVCFLQLCRSCLGAFTFYTAASSGHVGTAVVTKCPLLSLAALAAQPLARRGLLCSHVPLARPPPSSLAVARRGRMASFHEPHRPFTGLIIVISS